MYEFILIVKSTQLNIRASSSFPMLMKNSDQKIFKLTKIISYDKDKL